MLRRADGSVRYFSTREAARIQTFPDTYKFHRAGHRPVEPVDHRRKRGGASLRRSGGDPRAFFFLCCSFLVSALPPAVMRK